MTRKVLDVGQCNPDHSRISRMLNEHFEVEIQRAESHGDAVALAKSSPFDLILVNRILDATGTEGSQIIEALKADPTTSATPVILVSNLADAQASAEKLGAVPGFGKAALDDPATVDILRPYLAS